MGEGKATAGLIIGVSVVSPPTRLHHTPLQLWATAAQVPPATQPVFQPVLSGGMLDGCWGSHGWLSCSKVHARQRASHGHQRGGGGRDGW